ncbi:MAG: AMP-binding protein [Paracoccaceae bacterium]|nr:AMP-binding protein [Paracoccaceae bacterium]
MDAALYRPVLEKTNLTVEADRLKIAIPPEANIAKDTIGCFAAGPTAGKTALIYEDEAGGLSHFSFADLDDLASRFAVALVGLGVAQGEPVAVQTGQTPETAIAHMAIFKLGAVVLTLSDLYGPDTVKLILADSGCRILITEQATWDRLALAPEDRGSLAHIVFRGDPFEECLKADASGFTPVATQADDPALLMYTSGSTGMPKGMLHAHRILHTYLPTVSMFYDLELDRDGSIFWSPADWAWVGGLLDLVLPAWQLGQTVVASQHRFSAEWAFEFMARHRVTHSFMTPTALKRLAEVPDPRARWDLAVRVICTGGESLPGEVVRWAEQEFRIVCNEFYGLTEFNHMVGNCQALYPIVPGSMGRAYPGRRVAIIDDQGVEQPDDVVGEIASWRPDDPSLFLGYWGQPGPPDRMLLGEWLRSGDLAKRDGDGYFWYQGRNDDLIKSAGYRIGPAEVEDCLVRHPQVAEAAVIGKPDLDRGAIVKAFVRLMPGETPGDDLTNALQDHVKTNLAFYKYPREVEYVEDFPLTSSGKIRRGELRRQEIEKSGGAP